MSEIFESGNFNTSHVTVKPRKIKNKFRRYLYFNTSHVTVKPPTDRRLHPSLIYFNTSHVTVKRTQPNINKYNYFKFQYIPCYC